MARTSEQRCEPSDPISDFATLDDLASKDKDELGRSTSWVGLWSQSFLLIQAFSHREPQTSVSSIKIGSAFIVRSSESLSIWIWQSPSDHSSRLEYFSESPLQGLYPNFYGSKQPIVQTLIGSRLSPQSWLGRKQQQTLY